MAINYVESLQVGKLLIEVGKEYIYLDEPVEVESINHYSPERPSHAQVLICNRWASRATVEAGELSHKPTREEIQASMRARPARPRPKPKAQATLSPKQIWASQVNGFLVDSASAGDEWWIANGPRVVDLLQQAKRFAGVGV